MRRRRRPSPLAIACVAPSLTSQTHMFPYGYPRFREGSFLVVTLHCETCKVRMVLCCGCGADLDTSAFSKTQLQKGPIARCKPCVLAEVPGGPSRVQRVTEARPGDSPSRTEISLNPRPAAGPPSRTEVSLNPRPLACVPGFEALFFATDWPRNKKGEPPQAQSAIFNPLLACVIGPIDGHCSADQLAFAQQWWTLALPAWSDWVARLTAAGVLARRDQLLRGSKGGPNQLIPKARGHGTVPHFNGRSQNAALEAEPMVAIEVYACTACLYLPAPST